MKKWMALTLVSFVSAIFIVHEAQAQDLFEFQVYDSDLTPQRMWEVDFHFLEIQRGTKAAAGTVLPTDGQTHFAVEVTRGLAEVFELGGYVLFARREDGRLDYAGVRLRPRFRAPDSWDLPFGASLSFEFGWPKTRYEADASTLEIRPIMDKSLGRWTFDVNPLITRALRGPDAAHGLEFEPSAKISYAASENLLTVGIQYFGATGPLRDFLPGPQQTHFLHPNADIIFGKSTLLNLGVGFGLTDAAERLILTARFEYTY